MGRYPDLRRASAVVRNSSRGIVWQKANRSVSIPCADSIRLTRVASGFVQEGSSGGSFQEYVAFLASSAWNNGQDLFCLLLGDREEAQIRLGVGDHEQVGEPVGIVAGVVGQDVGRQRVFGLGAALVPEDRGERSGQLATHGTQGVEPGTRERRD